MDTRTSESDLSRTIKENERDVLYNLITNGMISEAKRFLNTKENETFSSSSSSSSPAISTTSSCSYTMTKRMKIENVYYHCDEQMNDSSSTVINEAVRTKDLELIRLMLKVGGRDLLMSQITNDQFGPLHEACSYRRPSNDISNNQSQGHFSASASAIIADNDDIHHINSNCNYEYDQNIYAIIEYFVFIGGKELLLQKTINGHTPLHLACKNVELGMRNYKNSDSLPSLSSAAVVASATETATAIPLSLKVIQLLVQHGGKQLVMETDDNRWTALIHALLNCDSLSSLSFTIIDKDTNKKSTTTMLYAIVECLLNIAGNELLLKPQRQINPLHVLLRSSTFQSKSILQTIQKLVHIGGKEIVLDKDINYGDNVLHLALYSSRNRSKESSSLLLKAMQFLIQIGGKQLINETDNSGSNPLHRACELNSSLDVIQFFIRIANTVDNYDGDDDITCNDGICHANSGKVIMQTDNCGSNVIHKACGCCMVSLEIIKCLLDAASTFSSKGGIELLTQRDNNGCIPLHILSRCFFFDKTIEVMRYLFEFCKSYDNDVNDRTHTRTCNDTNARISSLVLIKDNNGELPIHWFVRSFIRNIGNYVQIDVFQILLEQGMKYHLTGNNNDANEEEYVMGGLFLDIDNAMKSQTILDALLMKPDISWDAIVPSIQDVIDQYRIYHNGIDAPIIQAAIITQVSTETLRNIIHTFPQSILTRNSQGLLPIEIAIEHQLMWDKGMKEIIEVFTAFSSTLERRMTIHIGAAYGLKWECGMKDIIEENANALDEIDPLTGLYPFALAATAGSKTNLKSIYALMHYRRDTAIASISNAIDHE